MSQCGRRWRPCCSSQVTYSHPLSLIRLDYSPTLLTDTPYYTTGLLRVIHDFNTGQSGSWGHSWLQHRSVWVLNKCIIFEDDYWKYLGSWHLDTQQWRNLWPLQAWSTWWTRGWGTAPEAAYPGTSSTTTWVSCYHDDFVKTEKNNPKYICYIAPGSLGWITGDSCVSCGYSGQSSVLGIEGPRFEFRCGLVYSGDIWLRCDEVWGWRTTLGCDWFRFASATTRWSSPTLHIGHELTVSLQSF